MTVEQMVNLGPCIHIFTYNVPALPFSTYDPSTPISKHITDVCFERITFSSGKRSPSLPLLTITWRVQTSENRVIPKLIPEFHYPAWRCQACKAIFVVTDSQDLRHKCTDSIVTAS